MNIITVGPKIFLSFILGTLMFIFCGLNFPGFVDQIQFYAKIISDFFTSDISLPVQYKVWANIVLQDNVFVSIFFVIIARIFMAIFGAIFKTLFVD